MKTIYNTYKKHLQIGRDVVRIFSAYVEKGQEEYSMPAIRKALAFPFEAA